MTVPLTGWASFWRSPDGSYFLSDSYRTEAECRAAYGRSDVDGYIDLTLIPADAIKTV
jgi:hypothetical protein